MSEKEDKEVFTQLVCYLLGNAMASFDALIDYVNCIDECPERFVKKNEWLKKAAEEVVYQGKTKLSIEE